MKKTPVKRILKELGKLDEYNYPIGQYSLFILPDGRMVGTRGVVKHQSIFDEILKCKSTDKEFINILVDIRCAKITISNETDLSVDVVTPPTREQKATIEGLGMCSKYDRIFVDTLRDLVPDAPSLSYCRRLLKLPL